jgi:hypothetical protein
MQRGAKAPLYQLSRTLTARLQATPFQSLPHLHKDQHAILFLLLIDTVSRLPVPIPLYRTAQALFEIDFRFVAECGLGSGDIGQ